MNKSVVEAGRARAGGGVQLAGPLRYALGAFCSDHHAAETFVLVYGSDQADHRGNRTKARASGRARRAQPETHGMSLDLLPETVGIPAGDFVMGSVDGDDDERPPHRVYVDGFNLAADPVTNRDFARFVQATGRPAPAVYEMPVIVTVGGRDREGVFRQLASSYAWSDGGPPADRLDHPVVLVRYHDALEYCAWLAAETGKPIRLPTEAEWERAARAGLEGKRYPWGDDLDPSRANYLRDPSLKAMHGSKPVRSYPPSAFGLCDMCGNVWQWVADWYDPAYYGASPRKNPTGPESGRFRLVRGGSWLSAEPRLLTCSHRHQVPADTYSYSIGFRVAY